MNDKPETAPMFLDTNPTENSSLSELAAYALSKQHEFFDRDKKNGEDLWLMGQALEWAKAKVQHGEWEKWWKTNGFKKTYVWQARKLHAAASLEDVEELGLTEALLQFGVVAEKKAKESVPSGKSDMGERPKAHAAEEDEAPEPVEHDESEGEEPDSEEPPQDDLAEDAEKEFKEFEEMIRKLTPTTRAVAIHHALELLRDELSGDEIDDELQQTLSQIAQLAEEMKGVSKKAA